MNLVEGDSPLFGEKSGVQICGKITGVKSITKVTQGSGGGRFV
jgi:hypothetical protein